MHTLNDCLGTDYLYQLARQVPVATLNAYLLYKDKLLEGLNIGVGVSNILDTKLVFITPYMSPH